MDFLAEALDLKKEHGNLSAALLMNKLKIKAQDANKLIESVDQYLNDVQKRSESRLKKLEINIKADFD